MNKIPLLLAAALGAAVPLTAQTILLDTFDDGSRAGPNNLPSSMEWFSTSGSSNLVVENGAMKLVTGGSGRGFIGYFADAGSPLTLGVGETLSLSFDFTTGTLGDGRSDGFRIGLSNSFGNRIAGDNWGNRGNENTSPWEKGSGPYDGYRGYMAVYDAEAAPSNPYTKIFERNDGISGGAEFVSSTSTWTSLAQEKEHPNPFASDTSYSAFLSISRLSDTVLEISTALTGPGMNSVSLSAIDDSPLTVAFDTINVQIGSSAWDFATFDNIQLQVVPEPSTYALIAGGLVLGLAVLRRRRQA